MIKKPSPEMNSLRALKDLSPPTDAAYQALARLYVYFNNRLFSDALPMCLLTFQRQAKTMGYASKGRWVNGQNQSVDELAINPEYLFGSPLEELCQTMIHEQCHIWQYHFGTPSRKSYHDREWAGKMESLGLIPSSTGLPGGNKTGQKMDDYLLAGGPAHLAIEALKKDGFDMPWIDKWPARDRVTPPKIFDQSGSRVATAALKILGIKAMPNVVATQLAKAEPASTPLSSVPDDSAPDEPLSVAAEATVIKAINQSLNQNLQEQPENLETIFPVQLAAKAAPTRSKYACACPKPNLIWGRPGLKIRCEECQTSFTITV